MVKIEGCNESNINSIRDFILNVPSIKNVEDEILKNTFIIEDDSEILGTLSYERFSNCAMIRYFIIKKSISNGLIIELFSKMLDNIDEKIEKIYAISLDNNVYNLFSGLGFMRLDKRFFYLEESLISNDDNSSIMFKMLC